MTFDPARPRYTLPFNGRDYDLVGTFGVIEAVEAAAKDHVGAVAVQIVGGMLVSRLVKVVAAVLTANGHQISAKEVADVLWSTAGLTGEADNVLRLHLYAFLSVCLAPPPEREAKAKEMGEMMGKLETASPGKTTRKSASAA